MAARLQRAAQATDVHIHGAPLDEDMVARAYFVNKVVASKDDQEALNFIFDPKINLNNTAIAEGFSRASEYSKGNVKIIDYSENKIIIETKNKAEGFFSFK